MLRKYQTYRLLESDKRLIQMLKVGGPERVTSRHEALVELSELVSDLNLTAPESRKPFRMGIPDELSEAIKRKVAVVEAEEGWKPTFIAVLLEAAREYRRRYPDPIDGLAE